MHHGVELDSNDNNDNNQDTINTNDVFLEPTRRLTPKTDIPHNFGPISTTRSDQILFTAERPGHATLPGGVSKEVVDEWVSFMTTSGIQHVLVLLDDNEMNNYPEPGLLKLYQDGGVKPHVVPMGSNGAYKRIMGILQDIEQKNEKAVTHCTGGVGRAGRVAAAWLSTRYNLTAQDATEETLEAALQAGIQRLGDVAKLEAWMKNG